MVSGGQGPGGQSSELSGPASGRWEAHGEGESCQRKKEGAMAGRGRRPVLELGLSVQARYRPRPRLPERRLREVWSAFAEGGRDDGAGSPG